jgi:hypothetical protein
MCANSGFRGLNKSTGTGTKIQNLNIDVDDVMIMIMTLCSPIMFNIYLHAQSASFYGVVCHFMKYEVRTFFS